MVMQQETAKDGGGRLALVCGVIGVVGAMIWYWLVVPSLLLGLAAVVLGWRARGRGRLELGSVAMTLGVVAILLVPAFLTTADNAEDWGRDCALHPEADSNC
jgi:hypothetical protein